jgi:hypothetical protein
MAEEKMVKHAKTRTRTKSRAGNAAQRALISNRRYTAFSENQILRLVMPKLIKEPGWSILRREAKMDAKDVASFRSLLGDREYAFRVVVAPGTVVTVASNVAAACSSLSPLGASEWSGVIDALFDEYRVDEVRWHYTPIMASGTSLVINQGNFYTGTDYNMTTPTVPTSPEVVYSHADGKVHHSMIQSASGYFIYSAGIYTHISRPPKVVSVEGSVASAEWLSTAQAWPGQQLLYALVTAADGSSAFTRTGEYFVRCRMRR